LDLPARLVGVIFGPNSQGLRVQRQVMVPMLHIHEHISEAHRGKKALSVAMVQRLRACFRVPGDLLLPPPRKRRPEARAAA
jgi:hypothetical protein